MKVARMVALMLLFPAVTFGQRGGGGGGRSDRGTKSNFDEMRNENRPTVQLTRGDVEDMNPLHLLLDKRKQLKLTDDQQRKLKEQESALKEKNQPFFKQLDSLRQALTLRPGVDADMEKARLSIARESFVSVVKTVRDNYAESATGAVSLLDDSQKTIASELFAKLTKDSDEEVQKKLGQGGFGGRDRPPA